MKNRGMGSTFQRGSVWWIQYSHRGRVHRESSRSTKRVDATRLLKQRLGEIGMGRFVGPDPDRLTFEELMKLLTDDYAVNHRRSLQRTETCVKHLGAYFGDMRASEITTDEITRYMRSRQSEKPPAASASIKLELSTLKRAFNLAVRAGRLQVRPYIPSIEVNNVRKGFFETAELKAVVKELPDDIRPIIRFCYLTGWRISEVLTLPWRQVDLKAGIVRLEPGTTKNDEGRTFPCSALPELQELLEEQHERTKACELETDQIIPWVFHRNGNPIKTFRVQWQRACKKAGVPGRYVHDLRRTAVRNLERAGVPRSVAMKLSGHKTESIFRRYAIVSESDLADGVKKLGTLLKTDLSEPKKVVYMTGRRSS